MKATHAWLEGKLAGYRRCGEQNVMLKLEHHMTPTTCHLRAAKNKANPSVEERELGSAGHSLDKPRILGRQNSAT